tara:strand:- start:241 stop:390 length:150 start_codon:yes stop_codon:yes gene_type:complete
MNNNKNKYITLIDKDLNNNKITISKKELDVILNNAYKKVMKNKLKLIKK